MSAIEPSDFADDWGWMLRCPCCDFDYTHHREVREYLRPSGEDAPTMMLRSGSDEVVLTEYNPSPRRDAVRIFFTGECGHRAYLDIIQHKGQTFLAVHGVEER